MVGACGPPVCAFSIAALGAARAFDDPTLIDVPLNVEPAGGEAAVWMGVDLELTLKRLRK